MGKHHRQVFSLYTKVTTTNNVKPNVVHKCQNKFKRLKHHVVLHNKLVKFLRLILITVSAQ